MRVAAFVLVVALVLGLPAHASASPPRTHRPARTAHVDKGDKRTPNACLHPQVEIVAPSETATLALTRCDGRPAPLAVDQVSILARPGSAVRPKQPVEVLARTHGADVAPGVRRIDPGLVERLSLAVEHFRKDAAPARVQLVSGYRPRSAGSYHQAGKALDFRIDGVTNEALVAFCKTLPDTGCGYYPNSLFVHMDVRAPGAGHIAWIDASRPGEHPRYVSSWPPPPAEAATSSPPPLPAPEPAPERDLGRPRRDVHPYFF